MLCCAFLLLRCASLCVSLLWFLDTWAHLINYGNNFIHTHVLNYNHKKITHYYTHDDKHTYTRFFAPAQTRAHWKTNLGERVEDKPTPTTYGIRVLTNETSQGEALVNKSDSLANKPRRSRCKTSIVAMQTWWCFHTYIVHVRRQNNHADLTDDETKRQTYIARYDQPAESKKSIRNSSRIRSAP